MEWKALLSAKPSAQQCMAYDMPFDINSFLTVLESVLTARHLTLFHVWLRSQAPQQQHSVFSFSSMRRSQSQTDFFMCTTVLHCGHTFSQTHRPIELHCMHYGITLWAYLSEPHKRQSQMSKFDGKTIILRAQVTWSHITIMYVLRRGIRKHCT